MKLTSWKNLTIFFWVLQLFLIVQMSHFVLWYGQPEGYFEIFAVRGFLEQLLANIAAFLLLVVLLSHLYKKAFARRGLRQRSMLNLVGLFLAGLLLSLLLVICFGAFYFWVFAGNWSLSTYMAEVFPMVMIGVLFLNFALLLGKLLKSLALMLVQKNEELPSMYAVGSKVPAPALGEIPQATAFEEPSTIELPQDVVSKTLTLTYNRQKYEVNISDMVCACIIDRSVRVVLKDNRKYRYGESLLHLIALVDGDCRFFATASWVVQGKYIGKVEKSLSRTRIVYLASPFEAYFLLSKEKVGEFVNWLEGIEDC